MATLSFERHVYDKHSSKFPNPLGWLALRTMEDEINRILSRAESKFRTPNGGVCSSKTVGLLVRRHIAAGEFHYIGKEASTRWASGVDLSMMPSAEAIDPTRPAASTKEWSTQNTWINSGQKRSNFPPN